MSARTLSLPASLDVRAVAATHGEFSEALASGESLRVDASTVERVDTSVAQLLTSLGREARVTWKLSASLRTQLAELALLGHFKEEVSS